MSGLIRPLLAMFLLLPWSGCRKASVSDVRIVNGTPVTPDDGTPAAASVVAIQRKGSPYALCTGALISRRQVLTAAHCATDAAQNLTVAFGLSLASAETRDVLAHKTFLPFGLLFPAGDLAIITLASDAPSSHTPLPVIASPKLLEGSPQAFSAGFGRTSPEDATSARQLMRLDAKITRVHTGGNLASVVEIQSPRTEAGVCSGDSGGPLLVKTDQGWGVAGVVHGDAPHINPQATGEGERRRCFNGSELYSGAFGVLDWLTREVASSPAPLGHTHRWQPRPQSNPSSFDEWCAFEGVGKPHWLAFQAAWELAFRQATQITGMSEAQLFQNCRTLKTAYASVKVLEDSPFDDSKKLFPFADLGFLSHFPALEKVNIASYGTQSFQPLGVAVGLQELTLAKPAGGTLELQHPSAIFQLGKLRSLRIDGIINVENLQPQLPELQELQLRVQGEWLVRAHAFPKLNKARLEIQGRPWGADALRALATSAPQLKTLVVIQSPAPFSSSQECLQALRTAATELENCWMSATAQP